MRLFSSAHSRMFSIAVTLSATYLLAGSVLARQRDERSADSLRGVFRPRRVSIDPIAKELAQLRAEAPSLNPSDPAFADLTPLAERYTDCRTPQQVELFLQDLLRALPYESQLISSPGDIPQPDFGDMDKEHADRVQAEWQTFLNGAGHSIAPTSRSLMDGHDQYVIYVHQTLGGAVVRYALSFDYGKFVSVQSNDIARGVGRCWWIK